MNKNLRALLARKAAQVATMRKLSDAAAAESRDLTADETTQFEAAQTEIERINAAITRESALAMEEAGLNALSNAAPGARTPAAAAVIQVLDNREEDPRRGFTHAGEFFSAVHRAGQRHGQIDERLLIGAAAPTTFGNESAGADGGFAVPPDFSSEIWTHSLGEDSLLPMTDQTTVSGNSMVFPKDETTPWGTDGVRAYWQSEGSVATQTKPKLSSTMLRLYKLMALVPVTDELLSDTNALQSYIPKKVGDSIRWKLNEAVLWGTGNGTPLGAFLGNAVITVVKESGQATQTLVALNLAKMMARLPPSAFARAVWMLNNDVLPALFTLTLGNYPIYLPGGASVGGIQVSPYGMLLGRPIMVTQHAKSFSAQGDVMLADPSYIRSIVSAAGMQTAASMHLYFDADVTAFRTTFRADSQPKIINPIAPFNGSANMSPFVQLGAR